MTSQQTVALIGLMFSLVSVVLSGWFSVRTAKMGHRLRIEAERRKDEETAIKAAEKVYEPLAQAAAELQSRIYNIVETGWVPLVKRYESHGDYAVTSTAFLFAHYFGWIEARREAGAVVERQGPARRVGAAAHRRRDRDVAPQRVRRRLLVLRSRAAGDRRAHGVVGVHPRHHDAAAACRRLCRVHQALPQRRGLPGLVRPGRCRHGQGVRGRQPPAHRDPACAGRR